MRWLPLLPLLLLSACSPQENTAEPQTQTVIPAAETSDDKVAAVQRAFSAGSDASVSPELTAEIQTLFEDIGKAATVRHADAVLPHIDFEYLMAASETQGLVANANSEERRGFIDGLRDSARRKWFSSTDSMFAWRKAKVMRIEPSADKRFLLAYVRHDTDDAGTNIKARWWLVRGKDGWKIFDWEFLNTGIRMSRMMGAFADIHHIPPWTSKMGLLQTARAKLDIGDNAGALADLRNAADGNMPLDLEAVRLELTGTAEFQLGEYANALARFERVLQLKPDFPDARFMRGSALFNLERYADALPDLQWYVDFLGSDPMAMTQLAHCLTWLDRNDDARKYYRASLNDVPTLEALIGLAAILPEKEAPEAREWFERLENPDANFLLLAEKLYFDYDAPHSLREVCTAYRKVRPDAPELAYYSALLLLDENKPAEAAVLLRPALNSAYGDDRDEYMKQYRAAMYRSGQGVKAYAVANTAAERKAAFLDLARRYYDDRDGSGLAQMCEAWKTAGQKEVAWHFYWAETEFIAEHWAEAEKRFRAALPLIRNGQDFYVGTRRGLWDCMQHQDFALDAYAEFKPAEEVFAYLEWLLFTDGKADVLEKLRDLHAKAQPKDPTLQRAAGDLAWLKEDWAGSIAPYKAYIQPEQRKADGYWGVVERCLRAALRTGDYALAESLPRTAFEKPDEWLGAIALAGVGKSEAALAAIEAMVKDVEAEVAAGWLKQLYEDKDVGPKLRDKAYASLHGRFPPPAEK